MNRAVLAALAISISVGSVRTYSEEAAIAAAQLPEEPQPQVLLAAMTPAEALPASPMPFAYSSSAIHTTPPPSPVRSRVFDRRYVLLNVVNLAMTVLDIGMSQNCIAAKKCRESNPMMPSSRSGQISVSVALFTYSAGSSYFLKKRKSRVWYVAPIMGIATHTVGFASGMSHR